MKGQTTLVPILLLLLVGGYALQAVSPFSLAEMSAHLGPEGAPGEPLPATGDGRILLEQGVTLSSEQQKLIRDYMDAYYRSLAGLEMDYPDELFAPDAATLLAADKAVWEITVEIRKMQVVDLRLDSYAYELVCNRVSEEESGDVTVDLTESNVQNFRQYPDVDAESGNIEHRFTLAQGDGAWYVKQHRGGGTVSDLMVRSYGHSADVDMLDLMEGVPVTKELVIDDAEENIVQRARQDGAVQSKAPSFGHAYDREAAIAYAAQWSLERNPKWPTYDERGGNCANFTSQCLLAGGIAMDYKGPAERQWKWYGETANYSQRARGRSPSWASVDSFYKYATTNSGYGLVCQADADYYAGEPGDVLQLGFLEDWRHNVLITKVIKDENGRTIDYLVSSNTADQRDFPASAYLYTMQRLMKVYGWNE